MLKNVWGRIPRDLRERPFDVYTACVLFLVGVYGIVDSSFPERYSDELSPVLTSAISIYLVVASSAILYSLMKDVKKCSVSKVLCEFFGWGFIAAAALATSILYVFGLMNYAHPDSWVVWVVWLIVWMMLFVAASIRSLGVYLTYKGKKN
jgi:hypothetical protein